MPKGTTNLEPKRFGHHLFQVAVPQRIPQLPPHVHESVTLGTAGRVPLNVSPYQKIRNRLKQIPRGHLILHDADVFEGALRLRFVHTSFGRWTSARPSVSFGTLRRGGVANVGMGIFLWRSDRGNMIYFEAPVVEN
jgi:hypothetical protein